MATTADPTLYGFPDPVPLGNVQLYVNGAVPVGETTFRSKASPAQIVKFDGEPSYCISGVGAGNTVSNISATPAHSVAGFSTLANTVVALAKFPVVPI